MQEQDSDPGETDPTAEPEKPKFEAPMTMGSTSRELDLSGAESLTIAGKLGMMHPFVLLFALGMMQSVSAAVLFAAFGWVAVVGGMMGGSKAVSRRKSRDGRLVAPTGAMSKGFMALGAACLAAIISGGLGDTPTSFMILNGLWAALTMVAVKSATRTDAQSGWVAGATSQTAAALFFGVPLAAYISLPAWAYTVYATPFLSAISLYYSWRFMGTRGTARSRNALNAAGAAALGTLAFLPATAALIGFSGFEAACHFTVAFGSLLLPIWTMRDKLRPALSSSGPDTASLPSPDRPALPSE